ncbi:MAG: hypothetical protein ACXAEU_17320 [Candidatus Hodarchaeales archaeon]|jgi:uncharacterized membrane protein
MMDDDKLLPFSTKSRLSRSKICLKRHIIVIFTLLWLIMIWVLSSLGDMPSGTDTPIHFFKTYQVREFLQAGSWPGWTSLTQAGAPFLLTYPPLYYLSVAFIDLFFNDIGFSMKIFALLTLLCLYLVFFKLSRVLSDQQNPTAVAIFSLAVTIMYSMIGQHPFLFAILLALMSILCYVIAFPSFLIPLGFTDDKKRVFFMFVLSPLFFGLTIMTHLVAAYMLGLLWMILLVYQFYRKIRENGSSWDVLAPLCVSISGTLISGIWFFPALIEYIYQDHYKVTILQQIFRQEEIMLVIAIVSISPLLLVAIFASGGNHRKHKSLLKTAVIFFFLLGLGKYSPFFFLPLFDSLLPGRVFIFVIIPASLLAFPKQKSAKAALLLLILINSATLVYYLNPSVLGFSSIGTSSWRNSGVAIMAREGTLYGFIPESFKTALDELRGENDSTRVVYLAPYFPPSYSPNMQHYRVLFLSGHSTVQGDYPDSSEDTKWRDFTSIVDQQYYYYNWPNITSYLELGNVGWLIFKKIENSSISHYISMNFSLYSIHGDYEIWKSQVKPSEIHSFDGDLNATVHRYATRAKITVSISSCNCTSFILSETYHPRWIALDQEGQEVPISRSSFGFIKLDWNKSKGSIELTFEQPPEIILTAIVSIIVFLALPAIWTVWFRKTLAEKVQYLLKDYHPGK